MEEYTVLVPVEGKNSLQRMTFWIETQYFPKIGQNLITNMKLRDLLESYELDVRDTISQYCKETGYKSDSFSLLKSLTPKTISSKETLSKKRNGNHHLFGKPKFSKV